MNSASTVEAPTLYEVNLYVELSYPQIKDINGNVGSGRYNRDLPDWNIIFVTELSDDATLGQLLEDARRRFADDMRDFFEEHKDAIDEDRISIEYHEPAEDGIHFPDADEIFFEENPCVWESHWDEWEDQDEEEDEEDEE
jgi:hypothetical protein